MHFTTFWTKSLALLAFLLIGPSLLAQNFSITFKNPDRLFVCGADTLFLQIKNTGQGTATDAGLGLVLPTGVYYVKTSVNGAAEQNVNDLNKPIFSLPTLAAGQTIDLVVLLEANCAAKAAIDAGQLFLITANLSSTAGNTQATSTGVKLETGLLIIQSVENQYTTGERFDTLIRTIRFTNTRLGPVSNVRFEDSHHPGIAVSVAAGQTQQMSSTFYQTRFDGSFFKAFGNNDEQLDIGETAVFTEKVIINDCGTPEFNAGSTLRLRWGCGGDICQYDSIPAGVWVKKSTKVQDLELTPVWDYTRDHCGKTPAKMIVRIRNKGSLDAANVLLTLQIQSNDLPYAGLQQGSFVLHTSAGSNKITPNVTEFNALSACDVNTLRKAGLIVPSVPAGDSVVLDLGVLSCVDTCKQSLPVVTVDYFYRKDCPPNNATSATISLTPDYRYLMRGKMRMNIGDCLREGKSYPMQLQMASKRLSQTNGFLHLDFVVPLGLEIDPQCPLILDGKSPLKTEKQVVNPAYSLQKYTFQLPINTDSLLVNLCLRYQCDTLMPCLGTLDGVLQTSQNPCSPCQLRLSQRGYWTEKMDDAFECGVGFCDQADISVDNVCGPIDTLTIDPKQSDFIPGVKGKWKYNVFRLNIDYQDDNDDRVADSKAVAALPDVRRDRFLPGDTLRMVYQMRIDSGQLESLTRNVYFEMMRSDFFGPENLDSFSIKSAQDVFADKNKLRSIRGAIEIHYADGTVSKCAFHDYNFSLDKRYFPFGIANTLPPKLTDEMVSIRNNYYIHFDTLFKNGCVAKKQMQKGDSISITNDLVFDFNLTPSSNNYPDPPLMGFRTTMSHLRPLYVGKTFSNFWLTYKGQYSGFRKFSERVESSIKACEPSSTIQPWIFRLRIARGNMFPFEVRPLAEVRRYTQFTSGLQTERARLIYLALQDSLVRLSDVSLPFTQMVDSLSVDFSSVFTNPFDEGIMWAFEPIFAPNCQFFRPDSCVQRIRYKYKNGFRFTNGPNETLISKIGYFSNLPFLEFQAKDTVLFTENVDFQYDFNINNTVSPNAENAWLAVVSPSGKARDFVLTNPSGNQIVPGANGIFQLGRIEGFKIKDLRLQANFTGCEADSLLLIYGWDCQPPVSLAATQCARDTTIIQLVPQNPELELDILKEPDFISLCDSSEYFEFEVFNAKNGTAYDLFATLRLPDGLRVVAGSSQLSYPAGSPWQSTKDPAVLNGNLFSWYTPDLRPDFKTKGLPGVTNMPRNTLRIRFKVIADCGFVSNAQPLYGTRALNACDRKTNNLTKSGKPLVINGLNPTYGVQLNVRPVEASDPLCGNNKVYEVQIRLLGSPSVSDSVYVTLPNGAQFQNGSYVPLQNAPAGQPELLPNGFRLALPAGAASNTLMVFRYGVTFGPGAACTDPSMNIQTRVRSEAFCKSLGKPCTVYIVTGEQFLNINVLRPELELSLVSIEEKTPGSGITVSVSNSGAIPAGSVKVEIWNDVNGDGKAAAPDLLLTSLSGNALAPGQKINLSGLLNLSPEQLCNILLVLPADENCLCEPEIVPLESVELLKKPIWACTTDPLTIGVPAQNGFIYQWLTPMGITNPNSSLSTFAPGSQMKPGDKVTLILQAKSGNCTILRSYEVTLSAKPVLASNQSTVCKGAAVTLNVEPPGVSYVWAGQGAIGQSGKSITITPNTSGTYTVTVTFDNDCSATASMQVNVLAVDTTKLPVLKTCTGSPITVLDQLTDKAGIYTRKLKKTNGCDSVLTQQLIVNQGVNKSSQQTVCIGDTLRIFDTLLTKNGQVCRTFKAANGCDSIHCIQANFVGVQPALPLITDTIQAEAGKPLTLKGPGGYVSYTWIPPDTTCLCPSLVVTPDTSAIQIFTLRVKDANGCLGELAYRVLVFPPCEDRKVLIPNAFTPNGDGVNDLFRAVPCEGCGTLSKMTIYDRWGNLVYEGTQNPAWDGRKDGELSPPDVYVWIIEVQCGEGKIKKTGGVALLR